MIIFAFYFIYVQLHYGLDNFKAVGPVLTIGTFDGVHLGHREVIDELRRITRETGGESVAFTFFPHPRMVVTPEEDTIRLLSTLEEKIELLEEQQAEKGYEDYKKKSDQSSVIGDQENGGVKPGLKSVDGG